MRLIRCAGSIGSLLCLLATGCAARRPADLPLPTKPIKLVAVLEIEATPHGAPSTSADGDARRPMPPDAGLAVTGQIYAVLANRSDFRFVPDLTVADAAKGPAMAKQGSVEARARELGKAVAADGVIFGTVSRFDERVGTELGATEPASVAFDLALLETASDVVVWRGQFADTQEPLTSNLLQFWLFWESGPRWITARELSRIGAERLLDGMRQTTRTEAEQQQSSWWPF